MAFKPALIVVDFQNDFCPPNGSLAVPDGLAITPTINTLLSLPFTLKLATRDWHPRSHISFAANHPSSPEPFTSTTTITRPDHHPSSSSPSSETAEEAAADSYETTLWPVHCVADSYGAQLHADLDTTHLHEVLDKGKDERVEMYSAFYDPFHVEDSGLAGRLHDAGVTHVYVVGLAADFCVKATAEHAVEEGFETYIVEAGTRPVMPDKWAACREGIIGKGVKMIPMDGEEVRRVKQISP